MKTLSWGGNKMGRWDLATGFHNLRARASFGYCGQGLMGLVTEELHQPCSAEAAVAAAGLGAGKDITKIDQRIGRWQGRYPRADAMIEVELLKDGDWLVDLKIERRIEKLEWAEKANGCYLLRTDLTEEYPKKLWQVYIQLNQAERAFRMEKSDLWMRPIFT